MSGAGISLSRGRRRLMHDVSFSLESGQWLALTGPNGSGKSSLLRALCGLSSFDVQPALRYAGQPIENLAGCSKLRLLFQGHASGWKDGLTTLENLRWQAGLDQQGARPIDDHDLVAALDACGIATQRELPFAVLSAGQRRRLSMSRLWLGLRAQAAGDEGDANARKSCWLLDEPTTALDDEGQTLMGRLLSQLLDQGGFALVATHGAIPQTPPAKLLRLRGH